MQKVDAGSLDQVNFRELYHQFLLVEDIDIKTKALIKKTEYKIRPDDNAMLVFGYIDHAAGISFELLAAAHVFEDGTISLGPMNETASFKFRYGSFAGKVSRFTDKARVIPYLGRADLIIKGYQCSDDVEKIRQMPELDALRAPGYPDDIVVHFIKEGYRPEGIWCRAEGIDSKERLFIMKMLNEPHAPFGRHEGDTVLVKAFRMDDGKLGAFAILEAENKDNKKVSEKKEEGRVMASEIKIVVDKLADTMRQMARVTGLDKNFGDTDPGQLIVMELTMYAMYLSASDGEVTIEEAQKMGEILGFELTPEKIGLFIREKNIYSTDFEKKVPLSMQIFVAVDNAMHEQGLDGDMDKMSSQILYETFEAVGNTIILADGQVDDQEKEDSQIYLKMLKKYMDENLIDSKNPAKGFTKKGSISSDRMMDILDKME